MGGAAGLFVTNVRCRTVQMYHPKTEDEDAEEAAAPYALPKKVVQAPVRHVV